jgi:coenzyme PQQ precursor peptide PqqA
MAMKWKAPVIIEIAVGLEINAYACAEVKQARRFLTPADPARQPMLDAVVLGPERIRLSHSNGSAR